jgi:hypothetical protein
MWASNRAALVSKLDALITARLFGPSEWLAHRAAASAIDEMLFNLKLQEPVTGQEGVTQSTTLGKELDLDLLMVFLGIYEPWDAVMILQKYELLDETEVCDLFHAVGTKDSELLLRKRVQTAYHKYFRVLFYH